MRLFRLDGKVALVTGASRGIGRAIALAYAEAGADVALLARDEERLAAVAAEVEEHGRRALVVPTDVTDRDAVRSSVARTADELGRLDVVVNNAGGTSFMAPFTDLRFDGWTKVMRLNVDSAVHVCQAAAPYLLGQRGGSVVNIASVAALTATPALAPYGASKAALVSLTKSLAAEWAHAGVRVNALCPGWTATDLNKGIWSDEATGEQWVANVPMRRWGTAAEMAGPALFLASDAASYVTGQVLVADGGLTIL
jgi:2-deoxy-D-gluconate 3-dehydrogenase